MSSQLVALDKNAHRDFRIELDTSYAHTKDQNLTAIQAHEFLISSTNFPIVFVKNNETGEFISTVMTGLQPGENLFYSKNGWDTHYIPAVIRLYPFIAKTNPNNEMVLCIDTGSTSINKENGDRLFNETGEETDFLKKAINLLSDYMAKTPVTKAFINYLVEKQLIAPYSLTIQDSSAPQGSYSLKGIYIIDQKKLQALSDSDFLELRNKQYLPLIYAHLTSLNIVEKMANKKCLKG